MLNRLHCSEFTIIVIAIWIKLFSKPVVLEAFDLQRLLEGINWKAEFAG